MSSVVIMRGLILLASELDLCMNPCSVLAQRNITSNPVFSEWHSRGGLVTVDY